MPLTRLLAVRNQADRLRLALETLVGEEHPTYRAQLQEQIGLLREALDHADVPQHVRNAVLGVYRTRTASYVGNLVAAKPAGGDSPLAPGTFTIFRYAHMPRVEVRLISAEEWHRLQALYDDMPQHPEVSRVAGLRTFNDVMAQRQDTTGHPIAYEPIAPEQLMAQWLKPGGYTHILLTGPWETYAGKQAFQKAIHTFTSHLHPLHYFVQELVVYAPIPLLRDHVEHRDIPGQHDTQHSQGQVTEAWLSNVDGLLVLTRSDAAVSQGDKEHLVRQLRTKRLRPLRRIVIQRDPPLTPRTAISGRQARI